jgi:Tol biopolymer transport system component
LDGELRQVTRASSDQPLPHHLLPTMQVVALGVISQGGYGVTNARLMGIAWTYGIILLVVVGTGFGALLILGARLWGQMIPSDGQLAYISQGSTRQEVRLIDVRTRMGYGVISLMDLDQIAWSAKDMFALTLRHGEHSRIAVFDLQSRDLRQLTYDLSFDTNPTWSPDGQGLAFQSSDPNGADIYVMDRNGNNARRLTTDPGFDGDPAWSPDGRQIAFRSSRSGSSDLFVMDMRGNNVNQLTENQAWEEHPCWSPNGQYIAFASYESANWDLYVLEVATGEIRQLTDSPAQDHYPTWSPDGKSIAFESNRDGQVGIYVIDLDNGNLTQLTKGFHGHYFSILRP